MVIHENILNKITESGITPSCWKQNDALLIPKSMKQGHYHEIGSWRPIAILPCCYKLYTSVLCDDLHLWIQENSLLHPYQRSLGPFNGCLEHNFLLRSLLDRYKHQLNLPLHLIFLDITDAFGTISISTIIVLLSRMGLGPKSCSLILSLYSDCSTRFMCGNIITDEIAINVGVRQGCPLSMLLFNIGINPILIALDNVIAAGAIIANHRLSCAAYADDLVVFSHTRPGLQNATDKAVEVAKTLNLTFNASKCAALSSRVNNGISIVINNIDVVDLKDDDVYIYLGNPFGINVFSTPHTLFANAAQDLESIVKSNLLPWQKINAYQTFIHSRFIFCFRNSMIPIDNLTKDSTSIDRIVRGHLKTILGLPTNASNAYLYAARQLGGVGLVSLIDEYITQSISAVFQLLTCRNSTSDITLFSLQRAASGYWCHDVLDVDAALSWLNQGAAISHADCWWHKIRYSIYKLSAVHNINVSFVRNENGICLKIYFSPSPTFSRSIIVTAANRKVVSKLLHKLVSQSWHLNWIKQDSCGRFAVSLLNSPLNNKLIYNGFISIAQWFFVHKVNCYSLPVNGRPGQAHKQCQRCLDPLESMAHIFSLCEFSRAFWVYRHNSVLYFIAEQLKDHLDCEIYVEEVSQFVTSDLKVDLQIIMKKSNKIFLIDIKCPFQTEECLGNANLANLHKYDDLRKLTKLAKPDWRVELLTIEVGVPGSWPRLSTDNLLKLGLPMHTIETIAKHCILSNLAWTIAQWKYHRNMTPPDIKLLSKISFNSDLARNNDAVHYDILSELEISLIEESRTEDH